MSDERMAVVRDMLLEAGFPPHRIDLALQMLTQEPLLVQGSDYYVKPREGADETDLMGSVLDRIAFQLGSELIKRGRAVVQVDRHQLSSVVGVTATLVNPPALKTATVEIAVSPVRPPG